MISLSKFAFAGPLAFAVLAAVAPALKAGPVSTCDHLTGNLIQNCGFETGGVTTNPPNWTTQQFIAGDDGIVTSPVNSGSFALQIANDKNIAGEPLFNGSAIISQGFSDVAGATYQFSFFVFDALGDHVKPANGDHLKTGQRE